MGWRLRRRVFGFDFVVVVLGEVGRERKERSYG